MNYQEFENDVNRLQEEYDGLRTEFGNLNQEYGAFRDSVQTELGLNQ